MASIRTPHLTVGSIGGDEHRRLVTVTYELVVDADDRLVGLSVDDLIHLRGVDADDAEVPVKDGPIAERSDSFVADVGRNHREIRLVVDRAALDVRRDWWLEGPAGETRAVAEWLDHIAADIVVTRFGRVIDRATTPTVTGSWGVLGEAGRSTRT